MAEAELLTSGIMIALIIWNLKISRKHCQQITSLEHKINNNHGFS